MNGPFRVGQTTTQGLGIYGIMAPLVGLGISGSIAYVGMHTALNQRGWLSALGWVAGISGILGALFTFTGVVLGPELLRAMERAPQQTTTPAAAERLEF
jgi:hypothetical protein